MKRATVLAVLLLTATVMVPDGRLVQGAGPAPKRTAVTATSGMAAAAHAPTIVLHNGRTFATRGTPGGARIVSTTALLLSNLIDDKTGMQEAIEAPRYCVRDTDKELSIEAHVPEAMVKALSDEENTSFAAEGRYAPG